MSLYNHRRSKPYRIPDRVLLDSGKVETPELSELCLAIQKFRDALEDDLALNYFERISLENYIALLQMTYIEWKRRNSNLRAA